MFLHLCVILFTGGEGGWLPSMHHRSHDQGSVFRGGVCLQGSSYRGQGLDRPPPRLMGHMVYYGIRSTRGRYASYWNAFFFKKLSLSCEEKFAKLIGWRRRVWKSWIRHLEAYGHYWHLLHVFVHKFQMN